MKETALSWYFFLFTAIALSLGCETITLVRRPTLPAGASYETVPLAGQIERIDLGENVVFIRTRNGEWKRLNLNPQTRVLIRGRKYTPSALRIGDHISAEVIEAKSGNLYTELIRVGTIPSNSSTLLKRQIGRIYAGRGDIGSRPPTREWLSTHHQFNGGSKTAKIFTEWAWAITPGSG